MPLVFRSGLLNANLARRAVHRRLTPTVTAQKNPQDSRPRALSF